MKKTYLVPKLYKFTYLARNN